MRANDLALFLSPLSWVNEYDDANVLSAISALRRLSARPLSLRCCHTAFAFAPLRRSQRDRETMGGPRPGEARMATRCPRHFNTAIGSRPLSSLRSWHVSVLVLLSVGCSLTLTSVLPNCASLTSEGTRACACSFYGSRAACYNVRVRRPPAALPRCLAAYRHARRSRVRRSFATTLKVSHQPHARSLSCSLALVQRSGDSRWRAITESLRLSELRSTLQTQAVRAPATLEAALNEGAKY